ncbi:hypothetical protein JKF63_06557 [Porcisia hertigi]|uniref:Uncharacterized protein n=1 Tax=Porcisia hertigi TaxID=2761500 RepID=A0A836LIJ6_9TRYP|nr:hypothetical protein JKF63_06557 [Porcisia hertigi]
MVTRAGAGAHPRRNSTSSHREALVRYPNYDLLTGAPLDLSIYNAAAARARDAAKASRASSCPSPRSESATPSLWPPWTTQPPSGQGCDMQVTQAVVSQVENDPFFSAFISQQVGWIRLALICSPHAPRALPSSTSPPMDTPSMPQVSWQLPDSLRSHYTIPQSIADVPQRCLCSRKGEASPSTTLAPSSATAQHLPWLPPPPAVSVSVPMQEWWTGFFLHDAPRWWRREMHKQRPHCRVEEKSRQSSPETFVQPGSGSDVKPLAVAEEVVRLLSFLQEECRVPPPPVNTTRAAAGVAGPCPGPSRPTSATSTPLNMAQKASIMPPQVYVLRMAPVAPLLRRPRRSMRRGEPVTYDHHCTSISATEAQTFELQWTPVPDTATATVNTFFSLQDVLNHAEDSGAGTPDQPPPSSANRAVLFFIEVKAALEVLRRVEHAAAAREDSIDNGEDPRSPTPSSSSSFAWWEQLSVFYDAHTIFANTPAHPATTSTTTDESHVVRSGGGGGGGGKIHATRSCVATQEGSVSAFCHPTVSEILRTCVRLMLQSGSPPPHCRRCDSAVPLDNGGREDINPSLVSVAVWSRRDYNSLLGPLVMPPEREAPTPPSALALCSETADGGAGMSEEGELTYAEGVEEVTQDYEGKDTAPTGEGSRISRAVLTALLEASRPSTATGAATPFSPNHATRRGHDSSSCVGPSAERSLPSLPYGVEVHKCDKSGARRAELVSSGGRTLSLDCSNGGLCASDEPPATDRCLLRAGDYRVRKAYPFCKTLGNLGVVESASRSVPTASRATSSSTPIPSAASPPGVQLKKPLAHTIPLSAACVTSILESCSEATRCNRAPKQRPLNNAGPYSQHRVSSCAAHSKSRENLASPVLANQDGETPTLPPALPPPPLDVMATLTAGEHKNFEVRWKPWLRYLPLCTGKEEKSPLPTRPHLTEPRTHVTTVFPFLKPSAASEYCTASPKTDTIDPKDHSGEHHVKASPPPAPPTSLDSVVVVQDLGLCVLRVCWADVYVNASNLLYREETQTDVAPPLPPPEERERRGGG